MKVGGIVSRFTFSMISQIKGTPERRGDGDVELRGLKIASTCKDSPNMIFIPEIFDSAENWLQFFTNPANKIINQRNVYILYPRNFGNSDRNPEMTWETHADDIARFMYSNRISTATLAGHGIGAKIALAAACYHFKYVTGYIGIDSTPMNQYYFQPFKQLRQWIAALNQLSLSRPIGQILYDIKQIVKCPKWRAVFQGNLQRGDKGCHWKCELDAIHNNLKSNYPSSMMSWHTSVGLFPGRNMFVFPEYSHYVHLNTNTLPMMNVCPQNRGFNDDIFTVQGDENPQNHWVYELGDEVNPYAWRMAHWIKNYDGVHVLLANREEVGRHYIPEIYNNGNPKQAIPCDVIPPHYYHNWRFNDVYHK